MPDQKTKADSLRFYLTGASSDGGAQTDPNACLGNFRSSTEATELGFTVSSPISNVTVLFVAGLNGTGTGSLQATGINDLAWTPPGGTQGPAVTIANGETKILEGGGSDSGKYVRVTRTSATNLTGTATLAIVDQFNNVWGFDNVTSAEAAAGDSEYRCVAVKNEATNLVGAVTAFIGTLGTQRVSDTTQLGTSGAGTIATTGSFADWPDSGFCHIKTNTGTTREIVYYSSRTGTTLTVPAAGRAQLGTSAAAGASTDTVDAVPGIRIAKEAPTSGHAQTIANEGTAPTGVTWSTGCTPATGVAIGDLAADAVYYLWIHRAVPVGAAAIPSRRNLVNFAFDAA